MLRAPSRARPRPRARARGAAASAALSIALSLGLGTASALAGPGVTLQQGAGSPQKLVNGAQIAAASDTGARTYTVREADGTRTQVTVGGLSIRGLLRLAGFNTGGVKFVQVVGGDGRVFTLIGADIGSAIVTDEGARTRFIRPARGGQGTSDHVLSVPGTPLEMTVEGSSLLSIRAGATPKKVKVGQPVTFSARVRFRPPGAQLTYLWDFGDGTRAIGETVTHEYSISGDLQAQVKVQGSGGSTAQCASVCEGIEPVDVQVTGRERSPDQPQGLPQGSASGTSLGGTGTGGTGTGTGGGDGSGSAGGTASGSQGATRPSPKAPPLRAERPEPRQRFSADPASGEGKTIVQGVLLAGAGVSLQGALTDSKAGGSPKAAKGTPGTATDPGRIGGSLALALGVVWLGALRERRRVRLRVA